MEQYGTAIKDSDACMIVPHGYHATVPARYLNRRRNILAAFLWRG